VGLDDTTRSKIADHLKKTWRSAGCLLCGCTTWELHGHLTLLLGDAPGATVTPEGLPSVAVVCQRCGNTILINLVVANALPLPK
jgi:hypothetical protein